MAKTEESKSGGRATIFPRDGNTAETIELENDPFVALGLEGEDVEDI